MLDAQQLPFVKNDTEVRIGLACSDMSLQCSQARPLLNSTQ